MLGAYHRKELKLLVITFSYNFPLLLSLQKYFGQLPNRTFSSLVPSYIIYVLHQALPRTPNGHGKASLPKHGEVNDVIPHVGDFPVGQAALFFDFLIDFHLAMDLLEDHSDAEIFRPMPYHLGKTTCHDPYLDPTPYDQPDPMAITDIEVLELLPCVVHDDSTVGQNTIDVKQEKFDSLGFFSELRRETSHGKN